MQKVLRRIHMYEDVLAGYIADGWHASAVMAGASYRQQNKQKRRQT